MQRWEALGLILVILILVGLPVAVFSYQFLREAHSPEASLRISTLEGDPTAGRKIFQERCVACHGGQGEGAFGPDLRGAGLLGAAYLYEIILNPHNGIALAGHPPRMPELAFTKEEAINVVTYLLSIKDPLAVRKRAEVALAKLAETPTEEVRAR
ncbi:MAG: c-type cytochrome, partial [Nitrospinota bacterium]